MKLGTIHISIIFLLCCVRVPGVWAEDIFGNVRYVSVIDDGYYIDFSLMTATVVPSSGDLNFPLKKCSRNGKTLCIESDLYTFVFPQQGSGMTESWRYNGKEYHVLSHDNGTYIVRYSPEIEHLDESSRSTLQSALIDLKNEKDRLLARDEIGDVDESRAYLNHLNRQIERYQCDLEREYINAQIYYTFSYENGVSTIISVPRVYLDECQNLNTQYRTKVKFKKEEYRKAMR